ncbi:MAG TPA: NUDIX hydrolase [Thermoanaerobaculia bacterium]|jgi:8-oxo-dGTP pyrophosphatase MutT (NUDIX family)|nr:NUDIX hydrolase [Thermoanaerobaculia bacterium]
MLNDEVKPLPAASAIVLRDAPFEVLMMRRHAGASFMPNAWVFPGGIAEDLDHELGGLKITAARETFEETGVWLGEPLEDAEHKRKRLLAGSISIRPLLAEAPLDLETLVLTSRWITPVGVPKRFDTYFYLVKVSRDAIATAEQNEAVDVTWIHPMNALAKHAAHEMQMVFPTLRNLEALIGFVTADELIESRRGIAVEPIQPVLRDGKPTLS